MKFSRLKPTDFKEIKLHVSKRDKLSRAFIHFPIVVVGVNESEIWFRSDFNELAPGHYFLNYPTPVYITLLRDKDTGKLITNLNDKVCYHGVFHGIGEDEKKRIRQAVNKVFFSDLIEQREMEASKFDQMTQEALDVKLKELEKMKRLMELQQVKKKASNGS